MRPLAVYMIAFITAQSANVFADSQSAVLNDDAAKLNYSVGYQIGSDFKYQDIEVRTQAIIKGIEDAMSDTEALMSREEMKQTMADLGKKVTEIKQKNRQQFADEYAEKNRQFLVENGKKKGVVTTDSGLQYRVVDIYRGRSERKKPKADSTVVVNYTGKLIDGTVFDSTYERGKPASFKVNQVIKGWSEALQLMSQGEHWVLCIPAELGYGDKGAGSAIPPNSTLIFDVELIAVQ